MNCRSLLDTSDPASGAIEYPTIYGTIVLPIFSSSVVCAEIWGKKLWLAGWPSLVPSLEYLRAPCWDLLSLLSSFLVLQTPVSVSSFSRGFHPALRHVHMVPNSSIFCGILNCFHLLPHIFTWLCLSPQFPHNSNVDTLESSFLTTLVPWAYWPMSSLFFFLSTYHILSFQVCMIVTAHHSHSNSACWVQAHCLWWSHCFLNVWPSVCHIRCIKKFLTTHSLKKSELLSEADPSAKNSNCAWIHSAPNGEDKEKDS